MNQAGRDALREAALKGVRQIKGKLRDDDGGRCALGVLLDAENTASCDVSRLEGPFGLDIGVGGQCAICGRPYKYEAALIAHMNDDHSLDFIGIAEKAPVTPEPA